MMKVADPEASDNWLRTHAYALLKYKTVVGFEPSQFSTGLSSDKTPKFWAWEKPTDEFEGAPIFGLKEKQLVGEHCHSNPACFHFAQGCLQLLPPLLIDGITIAHVA